MNSTKSNIKEDLAIFNQIAENLLRDEELNPVAAKISINSISESLDIELKDEPISNDDFKNSLEDLVLATPKTATNGFFNQLFGGRQGKAVIGELLAVLLNNSMYTYKVGGPQVAVEKEIIKNICSLLNYGPNSSGTFAAGGSMSNYMAMIMARDVQDDQIRSHGMKKQLIAYSSVESHYSISKNASFAGIGRNNIRYIPSDPKTGKLIPEILIEQIDKDIENGGIPFFVNATAGTTVLGAYDSIHKIADICEKYNIWLHVDGALGGSVLFSENYNHLLNGIERSNSFCVNAHKMLGTPLSCSLVLVKEKKDLYNSFSNDAEYLYQGDIDEYNLGKTSFQCGRRNDALKFWSLWKAVGKQGLTSIVDHQFKLADIARKYVRNNADYTLFSFDDSISICFNYKNIEAGELCSSLYDKSELMVGYGKFKDDEFIRLVIVNANNSEKDILNFFEIIENHVEENY